MTIKNDVRTEWIHQLGVKSFEGVDQMVKDECDVALVGLVDAVNAVSEQRQIPRFDVWDAILPPLDAIFPPTSDKKEEK